MSEHEQFELIGRMTVELAELRRRGALIRQEMELAVEALGKFLGSVRPRTRVDGPQTGGKVEMPEYAQKYADLSKLLGLIAEQDEVARLSEELRAKLSGFGAA